MPLFKFQLDKLEGRKREEQLPPIPEGEKFTFKDVFAMIIAVLSLVLPWALGIVGIMGMVIWLFLQWGH